MARSRRRSSLLWVIAGMIFGIIAVILLYFLPKLPLKKYNVHKDSVLNTKLKLYQTLEEMNEAK
jgi:uncharacterized membrane protein YedE/YeeE